MFWHVLWIVGWMVGSATVIDIVRAAFHRRRPWAGITVDAEARRLERERELAPFLPEAQREVDRFLPGTPPIAPTQTAPVLPPAVIPAPELPANVAERPGFVDAQQAQREAWIVEESFHPTGHWGRIETADLVAAYWKTRREGAPGFVLGSIRREIERRFGAAALRAADQRELV